MPATPTLVPLPPQRLPPLALGAGTTWLGSGDGCAARVFLPGVRERHVAVLERADGWWATPGDGSTRVNGEPIGPAGRLLRSGDVLEIVPGCQFRFDDGSAAEAPRQEKAAAPAPPPHDARPRRKPKRMRASLDRRTVVVRVVAGLAVVLVVAAVALIVRAARSRPPAELTLEDSAHFDSLLTVTYDHIERGNTLLEIGASREALQEFAAGVNELKTSRLRAHPYVVPRIEAIEASIAAIYRERRIAVPEPYRETTAPVAAAARVRRAALTELEFAQRFAGVAQRFRERFGDTLVITGRDHAEHLSLYGRGGALDIRSRTMRPEQLSFVVQECRAQGIRVKDFSQDSVLRRQIRAAIAAGLRDRAGTGLHLHVDRFANRRDAFTVQ